MKYALPPNHCRDVALLRLYILFEPISITDSYPNTCTLPAKPPIRPPTTCSNIIANIGEKSIPPKGGIMERNTLRYGSVIWLKAAKG